MPAITFSGVLAIALVAVAVPVVLALVPRLPVPGAVLEVIAGILIGPGLLGWVHVNAPIQVLSDLGLGMLLFLAGLEIDVESLRVGFGFLIPVFFITTGVQFDARSLAGNPAALAEIPLFLAALLLVRGVPALLYARRFGRRRAGVAGLMQATSLTFVIVATQIGTTSGQISRTTSAALLAAGLLSAALFPAVALKLFAAGAPDAEAHPARSGGTTTLVRVPAAQAGTVRARQSPAASTACGTLPPARRS